MVLTSRDETDLLLPLYAGIHEERPFSTFLERLRRRTEAEFVSLILRTGPAPHGHLTQFFAGRDLRELARQAGTPDLLVLDKIHYDQLRPGRVYSMAEFADHDPAYRAERQSHMRFLGVVDERVVRLIADDGLDAWLILARAKPCSAMDSALLSNLAPYLREVVRAMVRLERQGIEATMAARALTRDSLAWLLFDHDARVIAIGRDSESAFRDLGLNPPRVGERLAGVAPSTAQALARAAADFAAQPQAPPRALILHEAPRLEALLCASGQTPTLTLATPVMIALCRLPARAASPDRAEMFARLHDLPRREAELALALAEGQSIAEAAAAMGLTLETARNYSKRLYAKLAVRGQAELVRLVHESAATLG